MPTVGGGRSVPHRQGEVAPPSPRGEIFENAGLAPEARGPQGRHSVLGNWARRCRVFRRQRWHGPRVGDRSGEASDRAYNVSWPPLLPVRKQRARGAAATVAHRTRLISMECRSAHDTVYSLVVLPSGEVAAGLTEHIRVFAPKGVCRVSPGGAPGRTLIDPSLEATDSSHRGPVNALAVGGDGQQKL